jgi:hypothetical protein
MRSCRVCPASARPRRCAMRADESRLSVEKSRVRPAAEGRQGRRKATGRSEEEGRSEEAARCHHCPEARSSGSAGAADAPRWMVEAAPGCSPWLSYSKAEAADAPCCLQAASPPHA